MNVEEFLSKDRFAAKEGIELLEAADGKAKARFEVRDEHLNGVDIAQGGSIFTLADFALAAAANSHGNIAVTVNVNISFLKAMGKGMLFAEACEISKNKKIASYIINIKNSQNDLIASAQGMVYFKSSK